MSKSHRRRLPFDHAPFDRAFAVDGLLSLEPRQLLTVYSALDNLDALGLNDFVRSIAAPTRVDVIENFGYDVAAVGDINGDGRPDFAVSAPGRLPDPIGRWGGPDTDQGPAGWVFLYSGADLSLIRSLTNNTRGFGASMAAVGDMNGDGVADLVVGAPNDVVVDTVGEHRGHVIVYSGANGDVINSITGAGIFFELGYSLQNVGDFNGDGHDDIIVGAPGAGPNASVVGPGCAIVYSLIDSQALLTFTGEVDGDRFGHSVAGGFDIPLSADGGAGDGVRDFVVGAPGYDSEAGLDAGRAYLFNGQTGLQFLNSPLGDGLPAATPDAPAGDITPNAGDRFGSSVGVLGASADGGGNFFLLRILVGAPGADFGGGGLDPIANRGRVYAFNATAAFGAFIDNNINISLADGAANDRFGERITRLTDFVMSDGIPEIAILAPGNTRGGRLTIGNGNFTNFTATGISNAGRYSSAAVVGDLDNDGINDFIFGEAEADDATGVPVRVKVVPFPVATGSLAIGPVSDDGSYMVLGSSLGSVDGLTQTGYVIHNGRAVTFREMGLEGLNVRAVNNAGLFYAEQNVTLGHFITTVQYLVFNGVRTDLHDAITEYVGPEPNNALSFASMNNTGDLVFNALNQGFLFRDRRLIFLWEGAVADINDSGVVAGISTRDGPGGPSPDITPTGVVRMYTAAGQIVDLPGLRSTGLGRYLDNRGRIYAQNDAGDLVMWDNGAITTLARFSELNLETGSDFRNWTIADVDDTGKVAVTLHYAVPTVGPPPSVSPSANYLYEPGAGLRGTGLVIADPLGLPPPNGSGQLIDRLINGNALLVAGHLAVPQPRSGAVDTSADHPIHVTWTPRGLDVAVSSTRGQGVILRLTGLQAGLWLAAPLNLPSPIDPPVPIVPEVNLYTDPRDGRSYAIVRFESQLVWFSQTFEGVYDDGFVLPTPAPITSNLAIFTSIDGVVHVVGLSDEGDLIMLFKIDTGLLAPTDPATWASVNISADHLAPQGQQTPRFVSDLTAYVTPWNGMNIAGIDDTGKVHTVWWAPGLALWQTNDLSAIAHAPALTGNVTSYVTPWSGLNVAGTTTDGQVATLWWVPQFGGEWRFDVLIPETPRGLTPGTLSAYVTSWGGLNIAGVNPDTGKVAVYWWTPTTPWIFQDLPVAGDAPTIEGRVTAIATPPGQLDIFARGESDQLLRFSWNPGDGATWTVDDISSRAL